MREKFYRFLKKLPKIFSHHRSLFVSECSSKFDTTARILKQYFSHMLLPPSFYLCKSFRTYNHNKFFPASIGITAPLIYLLQLVRNNISSATSSLFPL